MARYQSIKLSMAPALLVAAIALAATASASVAKIPLPTKDQTIPEDPTASAATLIAMERSRIENEKIPFQTQKRDPTKQSSKESVEDETNVVATDGKGLSFPGIYTAEYYYYLDERSEITSGSSKGGNNWLARADVIQIECKNTSQDEESDTIASDNRRFCKGDILILSEEEYQTLASEIKIQSSRLESLLLVENKVNAGGVKSTIGSEQLHTPFLSSLEYNSALTQQWVHPRMKVAEGAALSENRRLGQPFNNNSHNNSKRRTAEVHRDRNDSIFREREREIQYSTILYYDCYFDYDGTMDWIQTFLRRYSSPSSPLEVTWSDIGDSWKKTKSDGGYDIFALTITGKPKPKEAATSAPTLTVPNPTTTVASQRNENGEEPIPTTIEKAPFLIVTATHAREYTPPILVRKWLEVLMAKVEAGDPSYLSMLEQTKIHWIPFLNPDGRVLAETTQPWRRKNVNNEWTDNPRESDICKDDSYGVDLNRNCPFEWGKSDGSSSQACSQTSRGSSPGSEPETQALVEYATKIFPFQQREVNALVAGGGDYNVAHQAGYSAEESSKKWRGYDPDTTRGVFADIHSYGKVYIYPWGKINSVSPNDISFRSAMGHVESMTSLDALGPGTDHYGVASGATDDWAYGVLGAFSMTWELGSEFHEPCEDFEERYERHLDAFEYLAQIAPFPFSLGRGPVVTNMEVQHETLQLHYSTVMVENEYDDSINTKKKLVRMESNTEYDLGENITVVVTLKLPEIISSREDAIDYDDLIEDHYDEDHYYDEEPSSVTRIRIFFGGDNPLATAQTASSTFADRNSTNTTNSSTQDYWEMDLSSSEGYVNRDGSFSHTISISKDQMWEAFGEENDDESTETETATESFANHMLYFQAMDNLGNPGPINAIRLSIYVLQELEIDDDFSGFLSLGRTAAPSTSTPQVRFANPWDDNENDGEQAKSPFVDELLLNEGTYDGTYYSTTPLSSAWILSGVRVSSLVSTLVIMVVLEVL